MRSRSIARYARSHFKWGCPANGAVPRTRFQKFVRSRTVVLAEIRDRTATITQEGQRTFPENSSPQKKINFPLHFFLPARPLPNVSATCCLRDPDVGQQASGAFLWF